MPLFVPGQRWVSDTEPELGLGIILDVAGNRVTVSFLAVGHQRTYAADNAPLTRVRFATGDTVEDIDGHRIKITSVREDRGLLTYDGVDPDGEAINLEELELNPFLQFSKPQDRLFAGRVDPVAQFQLRIATLRARADLEQSPVTGLVGPRTSLIPHQLFIAHEVARRHDPRVMLADEVGLGKTIEAGLILHHRLLTGRAERALLIVPESLLHQWLVEMRRRFNLRFSLFDEERYWQSEETNPFLGAQLVLCSLDFLLEDPERQTHVLAAGWDLCVIDEAQHLRQTEARPDAGYALAARLAEVCPGLLLLTATPEQWGKREHFARLRLLDPDRFHDAARFLDEESRFRALADAVDHLLDEREVSGEVFDALGRFLDQDRAEELLIQARDPGSFPKARPTLVQLLLDRHGTGRVLFRNTRATVSGFPERVFSSYPLDLPEAYREALMQAGTAPTDHLHPEALCPDPGAVHGEWWRWDPRVEWLMSFAKRLHPGKILVICAKLKTALQLEQALRVRSGIRCAAFHEGLSLVARDRAAAWFADEDIDSAQVLICSEIGSEGRNFQFAHDLVLFDLPLDPDLLEQRIGRLDRIGQTARFGVHVPYFRNSGQESLVRWYADAMDAFSHPCPVAQRICAEVGAELEEAIVRPDPDRVEGLIRRSRERRYELAEAERRGRDRLLELSSCRPDTARQLIAEISAHDRDPTLWEYLEQIFDSFGVNVEDHSAGCYILTPSEHLRVPNFPELPEDGVTATVDRATALAREDMAFLTWEHPMVRGAMDLVLVGDLGNAAFSLCRHPTFAAGHLFVETFHVIESAAPRRLQIGRFLPPALIETALDAQGNEISQDARAAFREVQGDVSVEAVSGFARGQKRLIESLIARAEQFAERRLREKVADAETAMLTTMTEELKRLAALRRVNPLVRKQELDQLKEEAVELHHCLQSAQLRLEALRLIITV